MKKIEYKIKEITFPTADSIYFVQRKLFGLWMFCDDYQYYFTCYHSQIYCSSFKEVQKRLLKIKKRELHLHEWKDRMVRTICSYVF